MRILLQRVTKASIHIDRTEYASIHNGLLLLIGISEDDTLKDILWLVNKIVHMRIFSDDTGKMNLSLIDIQGSLLLVSQFTLYAQTHKGNRPSFIKAARPEKAKILYEETIEQFIKATSKAKVQTGLFGANMQISLINDGPVTLLLDSNNNQP